MVVVGKVCSIFDVIVEGCLVVDCVWCVYWLIIDGDVGCFYGLWIDGFVNLVVVEFGVVFIIVCWVVVGFGVLGVWWVCVVDGIIFCVVVVVFVCFFNVVVCVVGFGV